MTYIVMTIYPTTHKEMATRRRNLYLWTLFVQVDDGWLLLSSALSKQEFYGE